MASAATVPADVKIALADDPSVRALFDRLPPSHRREYLGWIGEARKTDTRARRIAGMIDRLKGPGRKP
jgi:uncharacterized protein YdeI (YjbR/CyaY-like superfamily)